MRTADYIFKYLKDNNLTDTIFMVPGGGAMFLNDAVGQSGLRLVCCHHEQAAAMAASGYSRYSDKLGTCVITTGCGGTNALTAVLGAYQDRIPMLIISGQVKTSECNTLKLLRCRQLGVQEADIISIVKTITVFSLCVTSPQDVKRFLKTAISSADYMQGPVWLDIPVDVQGAEIDG